MHEPRHTRTLMDTLGSASEVFSLDRNGLCELLGPYNRYSDELSAARPEKYDDELKKIEKDGHLYITCRETDFPRLLNECEDGPAGLFVSSCDSPEKVFNRESLSIVGTRDADSYGREWCARLTECLAVSDIRPTIVSGLAYGIDISAHLGALDNGLPTIAVLGTGAGVIYPARHEKYARRILSTPGCAIVSEYPPDVEVLATNFLSRNRIIAGLSRATVLVESKIKGGGMTTARQAASYNRDVYALPGRNDDIRSQGCNMLIHEQIADAIVSCGEFTRSLGYKYGKKQNPSVRSIRNFYGGSLSGEELGIAEKIMQAVKSNRGISVSGIAESLGIPYRKAAALTGRLESDGFIVIDILQRCSFAGNR